jgi:two-component system alkaline phosphatase synthesis response regulator PhoP
MRHWSSLVAGAAFSAEVHALHALADAPVRMRGPARLARRGSTEMNTDEAYPMGLAYTTARRVPKRILLVEDEPRLRLTLNRRLASEGHLVEHARDGETGLARASTEAFDLVVLDVMLPDRSGFEVCRELRRRRVETPVIMLSARGQVEDRVVGLRLGADDYLVKPFAMSELLARVEARLRRETPAVPAAAEGYRFGDIDVDFRKAEVLRAGQPVSLSAKEFQLLRYLVRQRGATLSRDELLNAVWGYDAMPSTRTVDVHVAWLRRKLEPTPGRPRYILTRHGLGYKFVG